MTKVNIPVLVVNVATYPGIDPTGSTDCTTALLSLLQNSPHRAFDFGGSENSYLISATAASRFKVDRDGMSYIGHGAQILVNYSWTGVSGGNANGVEFYGNELLVDGLIFINTNPLTESQREIGTYHSNGDLVRFGLDETGHDTTFDDRVTIRNCEFWGGYSSGLEVFNANRVYIENCHVHACNGNGIGFTDIFDTVMVDGVTVYNTGDDMLVVVCDANVPNGTQNVVMRKAVLQHGSAKGIGIAGAQNVTIDAPHISDTYAHGILFGSDVGLEPSSKGKIIHPMIRNVGYHYGSDGTGANARGPWVTGTNYAVGDVVQYHGAVWKCVAAHTAGGSFGSLAPYQNPNWQEYITYVHSTPSTSQYPIYVYPNAHDLTIDSPYIDRALSQGIVASQPSPSCEITAPATLGVPLPSVINLKTDGTNWTFTFSAAHGLSSGNAFALAGFQPMVYNGGYTVASALTSTTLTVANIAQPGEVSTFGSIGTATTSISLSALPATMPAGGDTRAVIYDPVANVATQFSYTSISGNTLLNCFANSGSSTLSFGYVNNSGSPGVGTSYVNVPLTGLKITNPKIRNVTTGIMIADGAANTPAGQIDYLQAYDVSISGLDIAQCVGGVIIGQCTDVILDNWKIRSYRSGTSGTRRAIQYTNMRNLTLGSGQIDNDDGGSLPFIATGTNLNVQGPSMQFRGAWAQNTPYNSGDAVTNSGALYVATGSFTSTSGFNSANWTQIAAPPTSNPSLRDLYLSPTGCVGETLPRWSLINAGISVLSSGVLRLQSIALQNGTTISNFNTVIGTTGATSPTHWWMGLFDANLNLLAISADQTTTALAANTKVTIPIIATAAGAASNYTVPTDGLYYFGFMVAASTVPLLTGATFASAADIWGIGPVLNGASNTGMSAPPTFPFQATAMNGGTSSYEVYAFLT